MTRWTSGAVLRVEDVRAMQTADRVTGPAWRYMGAVARKPALADLELGVTPGASGLDKRRARRALVEGRDY